MDVETQNQWTIIVIGMETLSWLFKWLITLYKLGCTKIRVVLRKVKTILVYDDLILIYRKQHVLLFQNNFF